MNIWLTRALPVQQTVQTPVQRIAVRTIIQMIIQTAVMLEQERAMEVRSSNNIEASPMELYIHIPFCIRKCDYCDFLSGPSDPGKRAAYVQALLKEIQAVKEGRGRSVSSIFIGGGTPSVLDEKFMGEILREIRKDFKLQEDAEITIEVNPGTVDARKLQAYRSFGINRLSIGLQSPQDRELKILGRIHNYRQFWKPINRQEMPDLTISM